MTTFENELSKSQSPYLLQHKNNPVAWKLWGEGAFTEAKQRDIPLLVSIGYSTCHWCHVMAHEVFEDSEAAELMNKTLVCIKVDREVHPEVDEIYMEACQAMNGSGGWPLNVILDHTGKPFFATTYVPLENWKTLIQRIHHAWKQNRKDITDFASQLSETLSETKISIQNLPASELNQKLFDFLNENFDESNPDFSGKGRAPRFPSHSLYYYLLSKRIIPLDIASKLEKTMEAIQDSGMHDRVGGGFHRYSTDKEWRIPHFEKMLYDNAQMMMNFALASGRFNRPDFLLTSKRAADYLIRDLSVYENGKFAGFASAEDADDPVGEGSFYAWTPMELEKILGLELGHEISTLWNVTEDNTNIHGVYPFRIPHPRGSSSFLKLDLEGKQNVRLEWSSIYDRLLEHRIQRPRPFRDTKVLTDWNALALMAFSVLYTHSLQETYSQIAQQLAELLISKINPALIERLPGKPGHLTDYGHTALALFTAWEVFGKDTYLKASKTLIKMAFDKFSTNEGHLFTSDPESYILTRYEEKHDHAHPAGAHSLLLAWVRIRSLGEMQEYDPLADKILKHRLNLVSDFPVMSPFLLCSMNEWTNGPVMLSLPSNFRMKLPQILKWTASDLRLVESPESALFQLCENDHCLLPAKSIEELEKTLSYQW